jgi:hypothetical protein
VASLLLIFIEKGRGRIVEMLRKNHEMKSLEQKRVTLQKMSHICGIKSAELPLKKNFYKSS